ncbi:MAG TPA: hypothetical protein VF807_01500 [Ktedonobacterales bacterium]
MRAIDDQLPVTLAILRKLREWGSLPESDLERMVKPYVIATDDLRELAEQGFIDMRFVGDEYLITAADLGRVLLAQQSDDQ